MSLISKLKGRITAILSKKLDERAKRMIVLSSLFGHLCGDRNKIDIGIAHKLNQLLNLSNKDGALMFPIQLSTVLWKEDGVTTLQLHRNEIDDDMMIRTTSEELSDSVPKWLKWDADTMRADIETLIRHKKQLAV